VFDGGLTRLAVERAELNRELVSAGRAGATQDLALRAARTFVRVLQLESAVRASEAAVEAAESDLARARNRRDVGLVTDADVLVVEVHLADVRQRQIAATADVAVARIELNEAIGAPLDAVAVIARPSPPPADQSPEALVREALTSRPEVRSAELASRLADTERKTARAAYLPRVGAQAGWEMNGNSWTEQRSSWVVGAEVQINVFRGFGDASRMAEATHAVARAAAERERVNRRIEVDVRAALARLEAAHARELAGRAALAQAQESHRILRDRYESGLATITDVLRASEGTLDAEARTTAAEMDVILETLALERAVGRL
jgi:outer membrane protein TolC